MQPFWRAKKKLAFDMMLSYSPASCHLGVRFYRARLVRERTADEFGSAFFRENRECPRGGRVEMQFRVARSAVQAIEGFSSLHV